MYYNLLKFICCFGSLCNDQSDRNRSDSFLPFPIPPTKQASLSRRPKLKTKAVWKAKKAPSAGGAVSAARAALVFGHALEEPPGFSSMGDKQQSTS